MNNNNIKLKPNYIYFLLTKKCRYLQSPKNLSANMQNR